jgi:hypothetical protein
LFRSLAIEVNSEKTKIAWPEERTNNKYNTADQKKEVQRKVTKNLRYQQNTAVQPVEGKRNAMTKNSD